MSKNYYKHFQNWGKCKLEQLLNKQPFCIPLYEMTSYGWDITKYKWLVNISRLAFQLRKERKTIKSELLRGSYWTLVDSIAKKSTTLSYSKDASDHYKTEVIRNQYLTEPREDSQTEKDSGYWFTGDSIKAFIPPTCNTALT
jgi:hypothetical protein